MAGFLVLVTVVVMAAGGHPTTDTAADLPFAAAPFAAAEFVLALLLLGLEYVLYS